MTFKEYLMELFDKPAPVTILSNSAWGMEARFKVNQRTYLIGIDTNQSSNVQFRTYNVAFYYENERGTVSTTPTGFVEDRHVVLATVLKFVDMFYKKWPGHEYEFSCKADDKSRVKLYDMLVKKFAAKHNLTIKKQIRNQSNIWTVSDDI